MGVLEVKVLLGESNVSSPEFFIGIKTSVHEMELRGEIMADLV